MHRKRTWVAVLVTGSCLALGATATGIARAAAAPSRPRSAAAGTPAISATPNSGLVQEDQVTVDGSGFIPNGYVVFEWCPSHALSCRYSATGAVDAAGTFSTDIAAEFRTADASGAPSDCNTELCFISATETVGGTSASASIDVSFDPNQAPLPPVELTVMPSTSLHDLQTVHITGDGWDTTPDVSQCALSAATCRSNSIQPDVQGGSFTTDLLVRRFITRPGFSPIDCLTTPCVILAEAGSTPIATRTIPITFDPADTAPTPPTVTVVPATNLPVAATVAITAAHFQPGELVTARQCEHATVFGNCRALGGATADATGTATFPATLSRLVPDFNLVNHDCAAPGANCDVTLSGAIGDVVSASVSFNSDAAPPTITVDPSTNLPFRGTVAVHGRDLAPNTSYVARECLSAFISACTEPAAGTSDGSGALDLTVGIRRRGLTADEVGIHTIDCVVPGTHCRIQLSTTAGGDAFALTADLAFDPSAPLPHPLLEVNPKVDLGRYRVVAVSGTGFIPNSSVRLRECTASVGSFGPAACAPETLTPADATGAIATTAIVDRYLGSGLAPYDCATAVTCVLRAGPTDPLEDPLEIATAPLGFTPIPTPGISIAGTTVEEGTGATTDAVATISLSEPTDHAVRVHWATEPGTATSDTDYLARSGDATVAPGATEATVTVPVIGDAIDERKERFTVRLSAPIGAELRDDHATIRIRDDDPEPTMTVHNTFVTEGGSATASVMVTLSAPSGRDVSVEFVTHHRSARSGRDYVHTRGTVTIRAGSTEGSAEIPIVDDRDAEPTESFHVEFSDAERAHLARDRARVTIFDND